MFPASIASVRWLRTEGEAQVLEVAHKREGPVLNQLRVLSSQAIELCEWKRRYDASFVNHFEPAGQGTRYTLSVEVRLKGAWRLLELFVQPYVMRQMRRFVIERAAPPCRGA